MLPCQIPETTLLRTLLIQLRAQLAALEQEGGYSTEAVIATALLAIAAITALGYIAHKITSKAKGLSVE